MRIPVKMALRSFLRFECKFFVEEIFRENARHITLMFGLNFDIWFQVKKRLDYQLQTANVIRSHEQRHMVDWIISNVKKSITPKQEEDALKKCVADLKALAK